jgi:hypothetical protein
VTNGQLLTPNWGQSGPTRLRPGWPLAAGVSSKSQVKRRQVGNEIVWMSVSENISALACEGLTVAEIARRLGVRYQHACNVLKTSGTVIAGASRVAATSDKRVPSLVKAKLPLFVEDGGFKLSGR